MSALNFSDNFGQTPLHRACIDSNYDDVYELLHNSKVVVEINATDYIGRTPLHYACEAGNERIVLLLMKRRADSFTPLHITGSHGSKKISEANYPDGALPDALSQIDNDIDLTDTCNVRGIC